MTLKIEPFKSIVGAAVSGIEVGRSVSDADFAVIEKAFTDHHLLLFRGQDFDAEQHEAFAKFFGALEEVRTAPEDGARTKHTMYVANRPVNGKDGILPDGEMHFHTDQCYYRVPARMTSLYAMEVPKIGGNTLFLSSIAAYRALSDTLKERLIGLTAEHIYDYGGSPTHRSSNPNPDAPRFVHPVVIAHPSTGAPALYVNRLMTARIVELSPSESDLLLEELFDHMEQDCFIHEHEWKSGDLLIWDNLCLMHARRDFGAAERRILRRVTVRGQQPNAVG